MVFQEYSGFFMDFQGFSWFFKVVQGFSRVLKGFQGFSWLFLVFHGFQEFSEAFKGFQWFSSRWIRFCFYADLCFPDFQRIFVWLSYLFWFGGVIAFKKNLFLYVLFGQRVNKNLLDVASTFMLWIFMQENCQFPWLNDISDETTPIVTAWLFQCTKTRKLWKFILKRGILSCVSRMLLCKNQVFLSLLCKVSLPMKKIIEIRAKTVRPKSAVEKMFLKIGLLNRPFLQFSVSWFLLAILWFLSVGEKTLHNEIQWPR